MSVKVKMDGKTFEQLMEEHNPFAFKTYTGRIELFDTYTEAYRALLERLFVAFPRGYIDMVVFLMDNYDFTYTEAEAEVRKWERFKFENPQLLDWFTKGERDHQLKVICRNMHFITETPFKEDQFNFALFSFDLDHNGQTSANHKESAKRSV